MECLSIENEIEPATTRCRMIPLDRRRDTVEAETRYRGSGMGERTRFTTWRLALHGLTFEMPTATDSDGESDDGREAVAQAIASAPGWRFGAGGEPMQRAV